MANVNPAIELIDQQANFIVVNKPQGLDFHSDEGESGLFQQVKSMLSLTELYPVHRLDKMTSGLIIFATTKACAIQFQQLFELRNIDKYYLAISDNKPTKKQGLIKGDMEKSRRGMWKLLRSQHNPAISQFFSFSLSAGRRLFLVKPHTGKTHQIRVALASIGSAILGDKYYSKTPADRGYLHAFALRFTLDNVNFEYVLPPSSGVYFTDAAFQAASKNLTAPWQHNWPKIK